jgi:hypothetical protein
MARPTKCTPEVQATILHWLRAGVPKKHACAQAGVTPRVLEQWTRAAKDGDERLVEFIDECEMAMLQAETKKMTIHYALAVGGKVTNVGPDGQPTTMDLSKVSLHALQFELSRSGTRPYTERVELTGKDGDPLHGDATPEAAAALIRQHFGGHARPKVEEGDAPALPSLPPPAKE